MKFLLGVIAGLLLIPVGAYLYLRLGYAPVATAAPPLPFEVAFAHMALDARISKEAPAQAGVAATEDNTLPGARLYRTHCAFCHGLMNQPKTATASGMYPKPPQLLSGKGVTDDPAGETFWKISNGIRLTGMPAYKQSLTNQEMWQISQMLATADKLPDSVKAVLSQPAAN